MSSIGSDMNMAPVNFGGTSSALSKILNMGTSSDDDEALNYTVQNGASMKPYDLPMPSSAPPSQSSGSTSSTGGANGSALGKGLGSGLGSLLGLLLL